MSAPAPTHADIPTELLREGYTLLRRLADGSTAEVFEVRHDASGRRLAVKVSRDDIPEAPAIVARMETEWNVGRNLRHPHLVSIQGGGRFTDGRAWLAMELLRGRDLFDELAERHALRPQRAIHIMRQVCEALAVLHRRGAVHRDIKPENIFLTADGRFKDHVKVIDLGILALPEDDADRAHEATGLFIMGTPLYLAPEQATGEAVDPRTDLYAVGGVLFHLIAGRPPFDDDDPTRVVAAHVQQAPPRLDALVDGLPPSLTALVHRLLEKHPDDRPDSAAAVIAALDRATRDLAGHFARGATAQDAPLPEVPGPGHVGDWRLFADNLEHLAGHLWAASPPPTVVRAVGLMQRARRALDETQAEADARRAAADDAARGRIAERERQQRKLRVLRQGLARMDARASEAQAGLDRAVAGVARADERYGRVLDALRGVTGRTVAETSIQLLEHHRRRVEAVLEQREALLDTLGDAREEEREAAEALAELRARRADVQRDLAELELEEQEDGVRFEQQAAVAADALRSAARAFERAALRLMLHYARALKGTGTDDPDEEE